MEEEAHRRGVLLERVGYDDRNSRPRFYLGRQEYAFWPEHRQVLLGAVCVLWHMKSGSVFLNHMAHVGIPLAVWVDHAAGYSDQNWPCVRYFDLGYGEDPGVLVASEIARRGYRSCVYISPFHGSLWSLERWRGLQRRALELGLRIECCVSDVLRSSWSVRDILEQDTNWNKKRHEWLESCPAGDLPFRREQFYALYSEAACDAELYEYCVPLFESACIKRSDVWVLCNDRVAVLAAEYLRRKGLEAPVLVGYDNSAEAGRAGISSFEFDTTGLARAMLDYLLNPRHNLYRSRELIRLQGFLVWR